MNKSPLTTILLTVLAFSALFSVVMCYMYISKNRELTNLNLQVSGIQGNENLAKALMQETLAYQKKNPSAAVDALVNGATNPAAAPTGKPATK
jgi:hypothetical protein